MNSLTARTWSPYAVGAGLGVLSWFAFATADHGLGITTAFEHTAEFFLGGARAAPNAAPAIDWEWMVVLGVFLGSFASSKLSGDRNEPRIPPLWRSRFGPSLGARLAAAFVGGAVMMFGARLARGCTSGHGITGALQFAVSSWIFIGLAFAVGAVAAFTLYGRDARHGV